jgi:hypothetical protein
MEKALAGQRVLTTGRNAVTGNGNDNGNRTEDDVTDRYVLGKASATKNGPVKQLTELQNVCDEVLAMYEPLLTEYQQALEIANPRADVAEAAISFHRHLERLIENRWVNEKHAFTRYNEDKNSRHD